MGKIYFAVFAIMIAMITIINVAFYWTTRDSLIKKQEELNQSISKTIKATIENNQKGVKIFEKALAEKLYTASLILNQDLPDEAENVTRDQLVKLAEQLQLDDITIIVPETHSFYLVQSTAKEEIGQNSSKWGDNWNRMLRELIFSKNVLIEPNFGQSFPHFWAGPIDSSYNRPNEVIKFGYFYDGSKNYIINSMMIGTKIMEYEKMAGVNSAIKRYIQSNPSILEINVVNFNRLNGEMIENIDELKNNPSAYHNREVLYGSYRYCSKDDKKYAQKAINKNKTIYRFHKLNGENLLQFYIPTNIEIDGNSNQNKMIIITTVDYKRITTELRQRMIFLTFTVLLCFAVCFLLVYLLFRYIRKQGSLMMDIQNLYSGKVNALYTSIREYRHDVSNHIYTLQGLLSLGKYGEAEQYLRELSKIHTNFNQIINIPIPAFIGLIQVRMAESTEKNIQFDYHFDGFEYLHLDMLKITKLVKIVGNILNNAFYEVEQNEEGERAVILIAKATPKKLQFRIQNKGIKIPDYILPRIFEFGFTTKREGSGIGLASAKKMVEELKGEINVQSNEQWTTFAIDIPLLKKEFIKK